MELTKSKQVLSSRQVRYGSAAGLYTLIVIAALVLVNWIANRYNKTYDATSNKQYTLSPETKKIIQNLKTDATIVYIDRASGFEQARGLLDRYANLSRKVHVQYVDYMKQPTIAREYGLRFPGTAYVDIGTRREEAKSFTEEGVTGAFLKDLKGVRKVCFVTGSHEHQLDDTAENGLSKFKGFLERDNYQAESISLLEKTAVPSDCAVLVVAGPQMDYTSNEITAIKNYVENGGRAMFLLDPPLNFGHMDVAQNDGLVKLLESWGVTPESDLVLEENPMGQLFGFGPEVPLVSSYETQPIVSDLKGAATGFPLSRSLEVKSATKTTVDKLFSTSNQAFATTKLNTNQVNPNDPSNKKGPFVLGAAGTYDTGKPNSSGRFVVIGCSSFLDNSMIGFQANRDLAENAVNWLSSDEDLISIRPKQSEDRRLNVTQAQMGIFFYTTVIAIPVFLIVSGLSVFLKRR